MIRFQPALQPAMRMNSPRCLRSLEERMADDLRELAFAGHDTDHKALMARGWTAATIRRLAPRATEIARRQSVRQVAP